jgi:hypothetical protein
MTYHEYKDGKHFIQEEDDKVLEPWRKYENILRDHLNAATGCFGLAAEPAKRSDKPSNEQVGGSHYKDLAIQPAEYVHRNKLGYLEGAVVKYVTRHKQKAGAQDIRKAIHCLQLLLEYEYDSRGEGEGEGKEGT